ncbi:macro domain-containing protein [Roseateles sp. UC29_93]|uniref:macro domain-containing protein n=1 Tax=Roseateles sp. UC29_93 TaxID=3350177 RepID=UPI0036702AF7
MITFKQGDLFDSDAEAIVNAVNTVGVMGKGIALAFKERFPENYRRYAAACKGGLVQVGAMFATNPPSWIRLSGSSTFRPNSIGAVRLRWHGLNPASMIYGDSSSSTI